MINATSATCAGGDVVISPRSARLLVSYMPLDRQLSSFAGQPALISGCQPEAQAERLLFVPTIAGEARKAAKKRVLAKTLEGLLTEDPKLSAYA